MAQKSILNRIALFNLLAPLSLFCLMGYNLCYSQNVGINVEEPDNSALLEMKSNERGFLIPRMTTADRDNNINLTENPQGLLIYNTTEECLQVYEDSQWNNIWCFDCAPEVTTQPSDQSICEDDNTGFSVTASGASLSYQWQENDGVSGWLDISDGGSNPAYSGATSSSLTLTTVPLSYDTYQYRCIVSGSCEPDANSNTATLTLNSAPEITVHPSDHLFYDGGNADFSVTATGAGLTYQWQENDGVSGWLDISDAGSNPAYSGATTSTLTLTNIPAIYDGYDYRCVVSGTCTPPATSNSANLTLCSCGTPVALTTIVDVTNPSTGETWMDRNLGASQQATAYNDYNAYGALFQWGRLSDLHECITWTNSTTGAPDIGTTSTNSSIDDPGHSLFITESNSPYDWRSPQNDNLWQGVSGINNPCPNGYRLPTRPELNQDRLSWSSNNYNGAYGSPLKLVVAGYRRSSNGGLLYTGDYGYYWSSSLDGTDARYLFISSGDAWMGSIFRAYGFPVRCIKD